jgi:hypothetical protein
LSIAGFTADHNATFQSKGLWVLSEKQAGGTSIYDEGDGGAFDMILFMGHKR